MNATMKILLRSVLISIWFVVLTFPVLCVKVAARQNTVTVLWERAVGMFVVMIVCSLLWLWYFHRKEQGADAGTSAVRRAFAGLSETWRGMTSRRSVSVSGLGLLLAVGLLLPLVLVWYAITELGSIAENAQRMGAPIPAWLVKLMANGKDAVDAAGDKLTGGDSEK